MKSEPLISVVVSNFNEAGRLVGSIQSMLESEYSNIEVILIDDGSSDEGPAKAVEIFGKDPRFQLVINEPSIGVARTFNRGLQKARGEFILIAHSDTRVHPDCLGHLLSSLQSDPLIAAAQPKVLSDDSPTVIQSVGIGSVDWFGLPIPRKALSGEDRGQYDKVREILAGWAACTLFRSASLAHVGGFHPDFFLFYEDIDLGWRLRAAGYRVICDPTAIAWHKSRLGSPKVTPMTTYYYARHILLIVLKNYGWRTITVVLPVTLSMLMGRAVSQILVGGHRNSIAIFKAVGWILSHPRHIWKAHQKVQKLRVIPDSDIRILMARPALSNYIQRFRADN